jgi:aminomethyltransferase
MEAMKKTAFYQVHVDLGAHMSSFGGYEMPLWYKTGARQEHLAVIEQAGLFDTSHMALLTLEGKDSLKLLQRSFSRDLQRCLGRDRQPLAAGRCAYGVFLEQNGTVLDDAIIYKIHDSMFMLVVNASMGKKVAAHLASFAMDVHIIDYTDRLVKLDIQGRATGKVLKQLLAEPAAALDQLVYFSYRGCFEPGKADPAVLTRRGTEILLSRTGYTGEFGVEIFVLPEQALALWQEIIDCGAPFGLIPCGLAARDSLRAGAMLPLSHQDIGDWVFGNTPWDFVLPMDENGQFTKAFTGDMAVMEARGRHFTYGFAGFDPRKILPGEKSFVADSAGNRIGRILTCTTDMAIDRKDDRIVSLSDMTEEEKNTIKGLSCGFVLVDREVETGQRISLVSGKKAVEVEIRKEIRPSKTAGMALSKFIALNEV